jgi:hypothetical protein
MFKYTLVELDATTTRGASAGHAGHSTKGHPRMNTIDSTTEAAVEQTPEPVDGPVHEPMIELDLQLSEAEALRAWLLRPAKDGSTSLEDPLVSRVLAKLGQEVDAVLATVKVRHELEDAGIAVDHLSDEQMRGLTRRVAEAARPGMRN